MAGLVHAVYLIERFDRVSRDEGGVDRVPFISGLTLLDASESTAHHHGYGELAQTLRRYGSQPDRDARELFRRMVFHVLVNNTDHHLRNHGYLHAPRRMAAVAAVRRRAVTGHCTG